MCHQCIQDGDHGQPCPKQEAEYAAYDAAQNAAPVEVLGENDTVLCEAYTQTEARRFISEYTRSGDFGGWAYLTLRERQDDGTFAIIDTIADPALDD